MTMQDDEDTYLIETGYPESSLRRWLEDSIPEDMPTLVRKRYAIRDDDLKVLEALCAGLQAAAGAGFVLRAESSAAITGIIVVTVWRKSDPYIDTGAEGRRWVRPLATK